MENARVGDFFLTFFIHIFFRVISSQVNTLLSDLRAELTDQWGLTSLVQRVEEERTEAEMLQVVRKKEREVRILKVVREKGEGGKGFL